MATGEKPAEPVAEPVATKQLGAGDKEQSVAVVGTSDEEHDADIEAGSGVEQQHPQPQQEPTVNEKRVVSRSPSRAASSFANANTNTVPRAQRRGLLGRFTVIPEVERPYEYKNGTKWIITAIVALAAAGAPMGSGIFLRTCYCSRGRDKTAQLTTCVSCPRLHGKGPGRLGDRH
jgi:hypothetical protein